MKNSIDWCFAKKESEIVEPDQESMKEFMIKANTALNAMAKLKGNKEWEITTAYYAMYSSAYAIMMKLGVKSKSHKCMIEVLKQFLLTELDAGDLSLIEDLRETRNEVQYHLVKKIDGYPEILDKVREFCVKCEKICDKDLSNIRKNLCNRYR